MFWAESFPKPVSHFRYMYAGAWGGGESALKFAPKGVWCLNMNPFRTAVPFWGHTTQIPSNLSPKRDGGPKTRLLFLFFVVNKTTHTHAPDK